MFENAKRFNKSWIVVIALVAAYAISFLDRQIVSLLVAPIKQDMGLTDTQIGFLQGPAFGIFYALFGLPLGWLADRINRIRLISFSIALWSVMTAASGLASDFTMLLICRFGVGIGEAALVPAAVSLIADLFADKSRAMPLSVFTAGTSMGAGLSLVLGGALIAYANQGAGNFPMLGWWLAGKQSWQVVFIMTGLLGLPFAAGILLLREPARPQSMVDSSAGTSIGDTLKFLWIRILFFGPLLAATSCLYILSAAISAWYPAMFAREFLWRSSEVGMVMGTIVMLCAMTGNVSSGALATYFERRKLNNAPVRAMCCGAILLAPAAIIAPLLPSASSVLTGMGIMYFGIALTFGVATTALAANTSALYRGQVVAIYLLLGNFLGLGLGPTSIGFMIDYGGPYLHNIGTSLALLCTITSVPAAVLLCWLATRR